MPSVRCILMSVRRVTWRGSHEKKMGLNKLHIYYMIHILGGKIINSFITFIYI